MRQNTFFVCGCLLVFLVFPFAGKAEQQPASPELIAALVEEFKLDAQNVLQGKTFDEIPAAAQGLIQLGELAVPALAELLHDDSAWLRWQAAWALQNIASRGILIDAALPALMACMRQEDDPQLHYPCISTVGRLQIPQAIPDFRKALHAPSRETVIAAMKALGRQGPAAQEAIAELHAAAGRLMGARRDNRHPVKIILDRALENIQDEDLWLARRLDELGKNAQSGAPQAVRELIALRSTMLPECHRKQTHRSLSETWLAKLLAAGQAENANALLALIAVARECQNDWITGAVVYELWQIGAPVVAILLQELKNANTWQEQRQIIRVIGDIGFQTGRVVPCLETFMTHEEPSLREAASKALDKIRQTHSQQFRKY